MVFECEHIAAILEDEEQRVPIFDKLAVVARWGVHRAASAGAQPSAPKRRKLAAPSCTTCGVALSRPLACLHCDFIGCWADAHATEHLRDAEHAFCVDVHSGTVFCGACDDFVYAPALEHAHADAVYTAEVKETRFQSGKRLRERYHRWEPSTAESAQLEGMTILPCQGRRGLLNLGQTCFLNVVLQALIHNPILRAYFLADRHNRALCEKKACTCCELDSLFTEIYTGDPAVPFGPTGFLAATWRTSSDLAGYAQRDAHECLITLLQALHASSRGSTNVSCNCVIHAAFAGTLQSDIRCARCGHAAATVDPMLDISLELKTPADAPPDAELTLAGCLRRFTQAEKLSSREYTCGKCGKGVPHEATKRMSVRKLPPILSFQFKRFEHKAPEAKNGGGAQSLQPQKIDARVRVSSTLNMYPFTSLALTGSDKSSATTSKSKDGSAKHQLQYPGPPGMYEYDLFAVICHEGQLDNGHYIIFARYQDEWYRYDDDKVTPSSLGASLAAPAYMCFYIKRRLDYKPDTTPEYILARKAEAAREEQREREKEAARAKEVEDELLATL